MKTKEIEWNKFVKLINFLKELYRIYSLEWNKNNN